MTPPKGPKGGIFCLKIKTGSEGEKTENTKQTKQEDQKHFIANRGEEKKIKRENASKYKYDSERKERVVVVGQGQGKGKKGKGEMDGCTHTYLVGIMSRQKVCLLKLVLLPCTHDSRHLYHGALLFLLPYSFGGDTTSRIAPLERLKPHLPSGLVASSTPQFCQHHHSETSASHLF